MKRHKYVMVTDRDDAVVFTSLKDLQYIFSLELEDLFSMVDGEELTEKQFCAAAKKVLRVYELGSDPLPMDVYIKRFHRETLEDISAEAEKSGTQYLRDKSIALREKFLSLKKEAQELGVALEDI